MPKTIDDQLADLEREWKATQAALERLEKKRAELHRRQRELHDRRERLTLAKLIGKPVSFKAGVSRHLSQRFYQAATAAGMVLTKIGRTKAHVDVNGEGWTVPLDFIQDPDAGLSAGMIL